MATVARVLVGIVLSCVSAVAAAMQFGGNPNDGQDPTRPRTRVDLRYQHQEVPAGFDAKSADVLILRADTLFPLSGGWLLASRFDIPLVHTNLPSRDNPPGAYRTGMGDVLAQGLFIRPVSRTEAIVLGTQVIAPTASEDQMGTGRLQLVPTAGYRWALDARGSFFIGLARYAFDVGGSGNRPHVSELQLNPALHFNFGGRFVTLWTEPWRYNLKTDQWFIPADIMVGALVSRTTVVSMQASVPIHYESGYKLYDWKIEARIGFFF